MKKTKAVFFLIVGALLTGCISRNDGFPHPKPVAEAIWLRRYSTEEFERVMQQDLKNHPAREKIQSDRLSLEESVVTLPAFQTYPTPKEWAKWKRMIRAGDEIWKFKHKEYGRWLDGPNEYSRCGYCLVRDLRVISAIDVDYLSNEEEREASRHLVAPVKSSRR